MKRNIKERKKPDKECFIPWLKEAKCYRCSRIGHFKERISDNVFKCECGSERIICPLCGRTGDLMPEASGSPNKLCTKCHVVVRPGRAVMTM